MKVASALRNSEQDAGVTPHRMRYAFSDLLRLAGVDQVTRRLMIGHVTEEMQELRRTASGEGVSYKVGDTPEKAKAA
ncbi:MAG: hypothetical protein ABI321_06090 [Polyangia bacterium]